MNDLYAYVVNEELRHRKDNKPFWKIDVATPKWKGSVIIWDVENPDINNVPRKGDMIKIDLSKDGVKDQRGSKFDNITMSTDAWVKLDKNAMPKDLLESLINAPKATQEQLEKAYKIITDKAQYTSSDSFAFVMSVLASIPKETLFKCPAAVAIHHSFQGGLIVHTAEVVQISRGIIDNFPIPQLIDKDVVLAGATLHDIGKTVTYGLNDIGMPIKNMLETTVGHIYYGTSIVERIGVEKKVDADFLNEVLHVIASHHNKPEYGAIKPPMTLEAMIVSQADFIGSRLGLLDHKLTEIKKSNVGIPEEIREHGDRFAVGKAIKNYLK